jgi:hypothetical protein
MYNKRNFWTESWAFDSRLRLADYESSVFGGFFDNVHVMSLLINIHDINFRNCRVANFGETYLEIFSSSKSWDEKICQQRTVFVRFIILAHWRIKSSKQYIRCKVPRFGRLRLIFNILQIASGRENSSSYCHRSSLLADQKKNLDNGNSLYCTSTQRLYSLLSFQLLHRIARNSGCN